LTHPLSDLRSALIESILPNKTYDLTLQVLQQLLALGAIQRWLCTSHMLDADTTNATSYRLDAKFMRVRDREKYKDIQQNI